MSDSPHDPSTVTAPPVLPSAAPASPPTPAGGEAMSLASLPDPLATGPPTVTPAERQRLEQGVLMLQPQATEPLTATPAVAAAAGTNGRSAVSSGPALPSVADYDILGELGRGGMGVVYRAVQRKLKRTVALKMILSWEHAGAQQIERFRTEAEALGRLRHPNIIQIYEIGEEKGCPFLSLEFADGGSLDRRLRGTPQPPRPAAGLVAVLARAMHAAHQAGVVHRDLKPANVLLSRNPDAAPATGSGDEGELPLEAFEPKITDFGLAKRIDGEGEHTRTGAIMGTPPYMAPEQAEGRVRDIGPRTDIYALTAILYELLTGRPPFKGATRGETLEQVRTQEPVPPSRLQPKVPRDLETICLKGLHKEPARRYATAGELAEDLRRFLDDEPILARRSGVWERGWKYARRKPWVVGAGLSGVAALCFLVAGGGYYLYRQKLDLQEQLAREKELADKRIQAATGVATAKDALTKRNWPGAVVAAKVALARVGDEPALDDLRDQALALEDAAQRVLRFNDDRDQAMYHAMLALEEGDRRAHRQAARAAARDGLALFNLPGDDTAAAPRFGDGPFTPDVERRLTEGCYEMFLTWADVLSPTAGAAPEEQRARAGEALHVLDEAGSLGLDARSYHERRAGLLRSLGRADEARREQKQADALQPTLAVDHFLLGRAYYGAGQMDRARAELKMVLEQQPDHFWATYCLAGCDLRSRPAHFDRALAPLTACAQMKPAFAWSFILRGFVNGQLRDFDSASADFATAEKLAADDITRYGVWVNRAVVRVVEGTDHDDQARGLRRQGQAEKAKREDELAAASYDAALPDLERAVALLPQQPQAHANLAEVHMRRERWDQALPQLNLAIVLAPSAILYRTRATLYEKREDFEEALPDLEKAIRREQAPGDTIDLAGDQIQRGRILFLLKDYLKALDAFTLAGKADPNRAEADQLRGETLLEMLRFKEAEAAYDRYLATGPPSALAARGRALARAKRRDYAGAVEDYTWSLEIDRAAGQPPDPPTLAYRGWAYILLGAPKLALGDFEAALPLKGSDRADCYAGRGMARVLLGEWRLAISDAEAALKEGNPTARTLFNAARIYAQTAARAQADPAQLYAKGTARAPTDPLQLARLGKDLAWQHEGKALELLRRACEAETPAERPKFWEEYVEADPALRTIARTAEFARMRSEFTRPVR